MAHPLKKPRSRRLARRLIYELGARRVDDLARLSWADDWREDRWRWLVELARTWSPPPFPVTGAEIKALGVPEGPLVGAVRKALEDWWVEGDFTATKAEALGRLETLVRELDPS